MSRNDAAEFAARLYARVPGHYRVSDAEQGFPLRALLAVVGEQLSALRTNLDDLWDDFFIETCDERIVPYLGALVGTKLLQRPVGQSNRLDVWNTVAWRRSKGTPRMLAELATSISGWPAEVDEFFGRLAWSEHLRHVRTARTLTVSLRDDAGLALLGTARDPFAHAIDLRPAAPLDSPRVTAASLGVPVAAFGTHGRYAIDRLGVFVDRLAVYPIRGATPAPEIPASSPLAAPRCFTFDPLFRDRPLFSTATGGPIGRRAFSATPWAFAADTCVRAHGVALVDAAAPAQQALTDGVPFDFGGRAAPFALAAMRIADPDTFAGAAPFVVRATWVDVAHGTTELASLGRLDTRSAQRDGGTFAAGAPAAGAGRLRIDVAPARGAGRARFPGAILALRAAVSGSLRDRDGAYVALPPRRIEPGAPMTWWIDGAGASYTDASLHADALARGGNGPVYPPRALTASTSRAGSFLRLHRVAGLRLADPGRFAAGVTARYDARIDDLPNRALGGIGAPGWVYQPTPAAIAPRGIPGDRDLASGVLVIHASGNASLPPAELIATNRDGETLVIYLPEISAGDAAHGASFLVADDGATYRVPAGAADFAALARTFGSLQPERRSAGAVLPIAGVWPLRRRAAAAIHHRRREPRAGELGIDPENGRFRLAPGDPLVGSGIALGVDFGEALRDARGALGAYDAHDALGVVIPPGTPRAPGAGPDAPDVDAAPTRVVAASGDAPQAAADDLSRVHRTLAAAFAAATGANETIEIADAATYTEPALVLAAPALRTVTLRAASGKRPAVVWRDRAAGLHVRTPLDRLSLIGVLASGAPLRLDARVGALHLLAVSLDPESGAPALLANDLRVDSDAHVVLVRAVTGPLHAGAGVQEISVVDSVIGPPHTVAIGGLPQTIASPPHAASPPNAASPPHVIARAQTVRLERATVFGSVFATVLHATDVLFTGHVDCADRTGGCVRYTRYLNGSLLPTRFRTTSAPAAFCSRRFGRVDYALLDVATDPAVRTASSQGAEPGVFASARDATRADNLMTKLREFVPVRLVPVAIAQT
jgi:hypothetical protein